MSKTSYTNAFFGVDRTVVEAAMLRGRQERSKALWALLQDIFGRPEASQPEDKLAQRQTSACAHC